MKFTVGYQLLEDNSLTDYIISCKEHIAEVYFSYGEYPNGRNNQFVKVGFSADTAKQKQLYDLKRLSDAGIKLHLLFNGNCYGDNALARKFFEGIGETTDMLMENFGVTGATVTSPIIAKFLKANFDNFEIRASVNMEIGTVEGMSYIADNFDGYYMKREFNRDIKRIKQLRTWCDKNGKKLYALANSGCLNNCSAHIFHDNLVAHETGISKKDNAYAFEGICHKYLSKAENKEFYLQNTNFIRPEDIEKFSPFFNGIKLATRANENPIRVIKAYVEGRFTGFITDILEPNHSGVLRPFYIDNTLFPNDFYEHVSSCDKNCGNCNYCKEIFCRTAVKPGG